MAVTAKKKEVELRCSPSAAAAMSGDASGLLWESSGLAVAGLDHRYLLYI
jgi:hypothetical protein